MGSKHKILNSRLIVLVLIALAVTVTNYIELCSLRTPTSGEIIKVLLLSISDIGILYSLIFIGYRPIVGSLMILVAQFSTFIYELRVPDTTITDVINDMGITGVLIIIAFLINLMSSAKYVDNNKDLNKLSFIKRLKSVICYKRHLLSVKWYIRVIVYSLSVTFCINVSRSNIIKTLATDSITRVYGTLAVVLPMLMLLAIMSTSYIAYEVYAFKIIVDVYTIIILHNANLKIGTKLAFVIIEFLVLTYSYIELFKAEKSEKDTEKEAKSKA